MFVLSMWKLTADYGSIHPNFYSWNWRCPFINFDYQKRYVGCNLMESSEFDSSSFMMISYPYHQVMTLFLRYTNWCLYVHTYAPSKSNLGPLYNRPTTDETQNGAFLLTKCSKFGPLALPLGPNSGTQEWCGHLHGII